VKAIIAAGAALLLLAGACTHEDTSGGGVWGRTVEPHLTTTRSWHACSRNLPPGHVVIDAQCAAVRTISGPCDEVIDSREQANRMLVSHPQCTDASIAALENFSHADAAATSDLAAAYYVRAQRKDNPADLLKAFDAARQAVALKPQPTGAEFNYALVLEALSLNGEAIEAWQRAAGAEQGGWAEEARAHRLALMRAAAQDGEHQWAQVRARIDSALDAHDSTEARGLIALFPATAERYFEDDVLRDWAASPSPPKFLRVKTFATALSQFFDDRYFTDVAARIANARTPHDIDRLRQGHLLFADARRAEGTFLDSVVSLYDNAARVLQQAGSPQYLLARIGHAGQSPLATNDYRPAIKELDSVAAEAPHYPSVVARVNLSRVNAYQFLSRYNDLFTAYDAATAAYGRIGDWEDTTAAEARALSLFSVIGLKDRAWREAFAAMRDGPRILNLKTRYLLMGATSDAAFNLDHPEAALFYRTVALNFGRTHETFLVSALDHLAAIELQLQRDRAAQRHLNEAIRLNSEEHRLGLRKALEARLLEAQGEMAMRVDPSKAIAPLTQAITAADKAEFTTFTAALFARRADAFARIGMPAQAAADRREALKRLHGEQELMLSGRSAVITDDLWNSYFSRFDETYDLLIRQLIDERKIEEAFQYAERARAFEPLDLVRKLPTAPAAFRDLAAPEYVDIASLRAHLPSGTFLIEYRVLDDQTYAWILGRDVFVGKKVPARRIDVKRWTAALQNAAASKDSAAFENGLQPPYDGLLKTPLEIVDALSGGAGANIVIIPDRELRGLPFAALRNPDTKRYVIQDHTLSMSGSALLYLFARLRDRDLKSDASALLIGDPAFNLNSTLAAGLKRLPFARQQAEQVHSFYPRSEILLDTAATPQQFLRLAGNNAVIDIAAHGVINGDAPSQSFLLFAASGSDSGVLNAEMLMKELHTSKTRLVVIGACSSAGGLPVGEEGIAPLVRPIIASGVPGVIGSLWDIEDATAARLLVSFHGNYRKGSNAAKALRDAQLEMLQSSNPGERSALTWAPFEAIGYASSPFASIDNMMKEKPP
jgi:CHAT domain-containing protein